MNKSVSLVLSIFFVITPLSCAGENKHVSAPSPSPQLSSHPDAHLSLPEQNGEGTRLKSEAPLQKLEASSLLLQVDTISPRFSSRPGTTEAIVGLTIKNVGTSAFRIPISGFTGKGASRLIMAAGNPRIQSRSAANGSRLQVAALL